ncbi:HNH endonuclease [Halomonas sp. MCCC 1A11062]|nr:HNH endonuclease [Halomonas sp. MCCC 1A11062]
MHTEMTHCIFCKSDTNNERSREHIIPESMGNSEHVLPLGAVCHTCNQYFARKVERPLLESPIFRHLRAGMRVPSKRGRTPVWSPSDGLNLPDKRLMGRFLGKVGLEVLVYKIKEVGSWNKEIVNQAELDALRNHVRFNKGEDWPFAVRTLHPVNAVFDDGAETYELLHEFDIFITDRLEYYSVVSIFGVEFALNIGGRTIEGFEQWLSANNNASPLYTGKNS